MVSQKLQFSFGLKKKKKKKDNLIFVFLNISGILKVKKKQPKQKTVVTVEYIDI